MFLLCSLVSCGTTRPPASSSGHLHAPEINGADTNTIPSTVKDPFALPPPAPIKKVDTYTVVVNEVPVKELLFQLARDAKLNIDIHPGISGVITLNAVEQTLPQILNRVSKQVSLRYQLDGPNLVIAPDLPYWRPYKIDYVNIARQSTGEVGVATRIATTGGSVDESGGTSEEGNISSTMVKSASSHEFWKVLGQDVRKLVGLSEKGDTQQDLSKSQDDQAQVIVNPLGGLLNVKATQRQHQQVQSYIDQVMHAALRQVLVEMTIVEVELSDHYQAGVDWSRISSGDGFSILSSMTGANLTTPPVFSLDYTDTTSSGTISTAVSMLETFGNVKVLSSPKVMALNNQTALLKVVDEKVYFTTEREVEDATDNSPRRVTYVSRIHTVPVGLVMSVIPQINDEDHITLNIRPTISRITGFVIDPAPRLADANFDNLIPEIQVREMETLLQVGDGDTIVMGGLMQNKTDKDDKGVPFLSSLPIIGGLFRYRDHELTKTELVIFIKPVIIKDTGFDISPFREYFPEKTVLHEQPPGDTLPQHNATSNADVL